MLESKFQSNLIQELKSTYPGVIVLKNDEQYKPGFPDLTVLWHHRYAVLECKQSASSPYRPNQEYYLERVAEMSFSATVYPDNKDDVLHELHRHFTKR